MGIYKTRVFDKWAQQEGVSDEALRQAVNEISNGLIDADLGGHVYKKRIAIDGRGKRGGLRSLLAFKMNENTFFIYGFAKNKRANVANKELKALKALAKELLGYRPSKLEQLITAGSLLRVKENE